jgi:hypothetical protein
MCTIAKMEKKKTCLKLEPKISFFLAIYGQITPFAGEVQWGQMEYQNLDFHQWWWMKW